jgi:hypothetical protein
MPHALPGEYVTFQKHMNKIMRHWLIVATVVLSLAWALPTIAIGYGLI